MKTTDRDERFVQEAVRLLDDGVEHLSPGLVNRLQTARCQALAGEVRTRFAWLAFPRWLTTGGLTTAAVLTLAVSFWAGAPDRSKVSSEQELTDLDGQEQVELYEDLEFYRWLADDK